MKTKVFLAAMAVAFSFAVVSCGGKKAADTETADATEQCDSTKACCQKDTAACCKQDSTACCKEKGECDKKEACDKKAE